MKPQILPNPMRQYMVETIHRHPTCNDSFVYTVRPFAKYFLKQNVVQVLTYKIRAKNPLAQNLAFEFLKHDLRFNRIPSGTGTAKVVGDWMARHSPTPFSAPSSQKTPQ